MKKGIEFVLTNGRKDWYDPVDIPNDFYDAGTHYVVKVYPYEYEIKKNEVKSYRFYHLCSKCGHELIDGLCSRCDE